MSRAVAPRQFGRWRWRPQPSLARRLMLTLLAAAVASFVVLVMVDWLRLKLAGPKMHAVAIVTRTLARSLPQASGDAVAHPWQQGDPTALAAVTVVRSAMSYMNLSRAQPPWHLPPVLAKLEAVRDPADASSPSHAPSLLLATDPRVIGVAPDAELMDIKLSGATAYWASTARVGIWRVTLFEPVPADGALLRGLCLDLLDSYVIALPLVMLPLWWAVRQGLRPLSGLAWTLRRRRPDDDTPLGQDLKHAELRPLATALNALAARTRQALARERRFVHDAAHELRTPLAVIATQAHALAHEADGPRRHELLHAVERAVARASHLGQQLLTLAVLDDSAPQASARRELDLVATVRRALADAMPHAEARRMELALVSPESMRIEVEPGPLQSVLENLIGNAITHGSQGGLIEVGLQWMDGEGCSAWQLVVADNGPGIPEADRARLFERFQRGADPQAHGSGLGLAIVRAAVERLGGRVAVAAGLQGRGAAFVVWVPVG